MKITGTHATFHRIRLLQLDLQRTSVALSRRPTLETGEANTMDRVGKQVDSYMDT